MLSSTEIRKRSSLPSAHEKFRNHMNDKLFVDFSCSFVASRRYFLMFVHDPVPYFLNNYYFYPDFGIMCGSKLISDWWTSSQIILSFVIVCKSRDECFVELLWTRDRVWVRNMF